MNPTPEQVKQWAREAGAFYAAIDEETGEEFLALPQHGFINFVTRAMAEQAETDAVICEDEWSNGEDRPQDLCAAAIRANAPKVTT